MTTTKLALLPTNATQILFETAIATVLALSLLGCGGNPAGTYEIDKAAMQAAMEAEIAPNPMVGAMLDSLRATLTLAADGSVAMNLSIAGQSRKMTGTWSASGDTVTLIWKDGNTGIATIDGSNLRVNSPSGEEMIMVRQ
ncbi:MAG: hypothetical protein QF438_04835 [Phycisphaerales bacterium]|jgi:hypothetical protein|nr:hypothetical protein [Arenicellales bacterium]MDP7519459.1 hypothetical protein [Phycisphaerales bacterium]